MLIVSVLAGATAFALAALLAAVAPGLFAIRNRALTWPIAVVFGAVAMVAFQGAATGTPAWDAVLRGLFAATLVYFARYARRQAVALSAAMGLVASIYSPMQPLAFAVAGLVLSALLVGSHIPVL